MTTTLKLPIWMKAALGLLGAAAFVSLALASFSMFIWAGIYVTPLCSKEATVCGFVMNGTANLVGVHEPSLSEDSYYWEYSESFPSLTDKSLYLFVANKSEGNWHVCVPLVSIGIASLLGFLFLVRRTSRMRREAIFAALPPNQES